MSGLLLVVVGLILALAGVRSLRCAFFAAGLGAGWLVATAFGASTGSALLWAAGAAVVALVLAVVAARERSSPSSSGPPWPWLRASSRSDCQAGPTLRSPRPELT